MGLCVYLLLVHFDGVFQVNTNVFVVSSLFWCFMCPRFCGFYKKNRNKHGATETLQSHRAL